MNTVEYVEETQKLTAPTLDMHRALVSLSEKLIEIDCYNQRIDACTDTSLMSILKSSREVEKKEMAKLIEWMRRHDPQLDHALRASLFKAGPIVEED